MSLGCSRHVCEGSSGTPAPPTLLHSLLLPGRGVSGFALLCTSASSPGPRLQGQAITDWNHKAVSHSRPSLCVSVLTAPWCWLWELGISSVGDSLARCTEMLLHLKCSVAGYKILPAHSPFFVVLGIEIRHLCHIPQSFGFCFSGRVSC
jgi:hypothetical protein